MHYLEERKIKTKNRLRRKFAGIPEPNSNEALIGFVAWLTTRKKTIKVGSSEAVYDIVELYAEYSRLNALPEVRDSHYPDCLEFPKEEK